VDSEDSGSVDVELLQVLAAKFEDAARIRVSRKDEMQVSFCAYRFFLGSSVGLTPSMERYLVT
jgi:hypothetical protein